MKAPLSQAARTALRTLLRDAGVGAEVRTFLSSPPGKPVLDPSSAEPRTLEDVALRGAYAEGYRRVLADFEEAISSHSSPEPRAKHPSSIS